MQLDDELPGGTHRSDGMGTRRSDADFKEFEKTGFHFSIRKDVGQLCVVYRDFSRFSVRGSEVCCSNHLERFMLNCAVDNYPAKILLRDQR